MDMSSLQLELRGIFGAEVESLIHKVASSFLHKTSTSAESEREEKRVGRVDRLLQVRNEMD